MVFHSKRTSAMQLCGQRYYEHEKGKTREMTVLPPSNSNPRLSSRPGSCDGQWCLWCDYCCFYQASSFTFCVPFAVPCLFLLQSGVWDRNSSHFWCTSFFFFSQVLCRTLMKCLAVPEVFIPKLCCLAVVLPQTKQPDHAARSELIMAPSHAVIFIH